MDTRPEALLCTTNSRERRAGPAVASGVLLLFMLPLLAAATATSLHILTRHSMSLSGPCPMTTRGLKALPGGVWIILVGLSHLTIHSFSPR